MRKNIRFKTLREVRLEQAKKVNGRLCEVDGQPAFFHRWVQHDHIVVQYNCLIREAEAEAKAKRSQETGLYGPGQETRILTQTFALVELLDGHVKKVAPEKVRFCDREEAER